MLIAVSVLFLLPQRAWADLAFGLFADHWPAVIPIILIEIFIFQYLINKLFFYKNYIQKKIDIGQTICIVITANVVSTVVGILIEGHYYAPAISHQFALGKAIILGVAFLMSALLEWIVYLPFFRQMAERRQKWTNLLKVSFAVNLIPYLLLAILILPVPHHAYDPDRNRGSKTMSNAKN